MRQPTKKEQLQLLRYLIYVGGLIPLALLWWDWWNYRVGPDCAPVYSTCANWIREITLQTGYAALVLLMLSLVVTPLVIVSGWSHLTPVRKPLGLYAFFYVCLHLLIFVVLDYGGNIVWVFEELTTRRFAIAGFAAFLLLLPLALTSTTWAIRKLGKWWRRLHRLVYVAAILAVVHFLWLVKGDYGEPLAFTAVLTLLLFIRLPPVRQKVIQWRRNWSTSPQRT